MLRSTFSDQGELEAHHSFHFCISVLLNPLTTNVWRTWMGKGRDLIYGVGTGVQMLYSAYLLAIKP